MKTWLFKTEPNEYSITDLERERQTCWNGIRNYQARNLLRDQVSVNDRVLVYHSSCKPTAITGSALVCKSAYPDPSQFDPNSPYYDAKTSRDKPRWYCVDIEFSERYPVAITLQQLRDQSGLAEMVLLKQGRLSIQPVTAQEYSVIQAMTR